MKFNIIRNAYSLHRRDAFSVALASPSFILPTSLSSLLLSLFLSLSVITATFRASLFIPLVAFSKKIKMIIRFTWGGEIPRSRQYVGRRILKLI